MGDDVVVPLRGRGRPRGSVTALGPAEQAAGDRLNAQRFLEQYGHIVRYVAESGRWLLWDGRCWHEDTQGEVWELAGQLADSQYQHSLTIADEDQRRHAVAGAKRASTASAIDAMLKLASRGSAVTINLDELDPDPWSLNVANGVLHLRTLELVDPHPSMLVCRQSPVVWDPKATHPEVDAFLTRVMPDAGLREWVQRAMGYTLTGRIEENICVYLWGPTASGKTTFLELFGMVLGTYGSVASIRTFMKSAKGNSAGHTEDVAALAGTRYVRASEPSEGDTWDDGLLKQVTGNEQVRARFPFQPRGFMFMPRFKLWCAGNHRPRVSGDDPAVWRRLVVVPFAETIPPGQRDKYLLAKLKQDPRALAALLRWAVDGGQRWLAGGLGELPGAIAETTGQYRRHMDTLSLFLDDRCVADPRGWVGRTEMLIAYTGWCREVGMRVLDPRTFEDKMAEHARLGRLSSGRNVWIGWHLHDVVRRSLD